MDDPCCADLHNFTLVLYHWVCSINLDTDQGENIGHYKIDELTSWQQISSLWYFGIESWTQ